MFGCQAPDSGNAEILAHYGTDELKERYLEPLLRNEIVSAFSMTEPQGGSDPTGFVTRAELDGDEWVINGEKWFSSHANFAAFLIVLAVTEPDERASQADVDVRRRRPTRPASRSSATSAVYGHPEEQGTHSYVRYTDVRIPADHLLGGRGEGFIVAQTRLGGGRIHHAMRTVGLVKSAFDMMCERALSRTTQGETLARKQLVQEMIADSWIQLEQFRLLVLRTAWRIDKYNDYQRVRGDISAVKAAMPKVLHDVAGRALQIHGSLGVSARDAVRVDGARVVPHGPGRRRHRGAQGHAGPRAAEGLHAHAGPVPHPPPPQAAGRGRGSLRRGPGGRRSGLRSRNAGRCITIRDPPSTADPR